VVSTHDRCAYGSIDFELSDVPGSYDFFEGKPGVEAVAGVGDKALWSPQMNQLAAVKGDLDVLIRAPSREEATSVYFQVMSRAPR
jgi:hypothetical protein